jgi:hypothetical protein
MQWIKNNYYTGLFTVIIALVIQRTLCMDRITLSSVACTALQYFSTLFHKRHKFVKEDMKHKICFDFFYHFFLKQFLNYKELNVTS